VDAAFGGERLELGELEAAQIGACIDISHDWGFLRFDPGTERPGNRRFASRGSV
jgi:hypothetical protein